MSSAKTGQRPLKLAARGKRAMRSQFGALCWRRAGDEVEVLLVSTRKARRWVIPKGWPLARRTPADSAATEAWEEAGVTGDVSPRLVGIYSYLKGRGRGPRLPCVVMVFPLEVLHEAGDWPEKRQRRRRWVSPAKAASLVDAPELAALLRAFDPAAT